VAGALTSLTATEHDGATTESSVVGRPPSRLMAQQPYDRTASGENAASFEPPLAWFVQAHLGLRRAEQGDSDDVCNPLHEVIG
jgi:hypothetical protein